jgi:hypothetical protein
VTKEVSQQILINQRALFFPQKRAETVLCNRNSWSAVSRRRSIFDLSLSVDTRRRKARTEVTVWTDELTVTVLCSAVSERLNREAAGPAYSIGGSRVWPLKRHKTPRVRHPPCPPWPPCDVFSSVCRSELDRLFLTIPWGSTALSAALHPRLGLFRAFGAWEPETGDRLSLRATAYFGKCSSSFLIRWARGEN